MNNIPDFAMQVQEIERQIEAQSEVTAGDWKDDVRKRYYDNYVNQYKEKLELYIHGGSDMTGKGINDLLVFLNEKMQEMEGLTGISADVSFMMAAGNSYYGGVKDNFNSEINVEDAQEVKRRNGIVHNDYHERDYWSDRNSCSGNGPRPGEYTGEDIEEIMEKRRK